MNTTLIAAAAATVTSLARPFFTFLFIAAQITAGMWWMLGHEAAKDASAMLGPFTMMVVTFWFKDRADEKATAATVAANQNSST